MAEPTEPPPLPEDSAGPPAMPRPAPPVRPTAPVAAHRSSWPTVIGIFLCVFGGLGLVQRFFGVVFVAIMPLLPLPPEMTVTGTLWKAGLALSIVGLPLSIIHLTAGILTLRRRPSSRAWVVAFFAYALVVTPPGAIYQYASTHQQVRQAAQQGHPPPGMAAFGTGFAMVMAVLTVVLALLWPSFLMIWYSRPRIRQEVRSWNAA